MSQVTTERRYALSATSLTTAAVQSATVTDRIRALAGDGRILLASISIELSKDGPFIPDLRSRCAATTFRIEQLYADLREVLRPPCGEMLLGSDPDLESDEPWLLALARKEGCTVVAEHSPLSRLGRPAAVLGIPIVDLSRFLAEA
jgi:hypothetical protein